MEAAKKEKQRFQFSILALVNVLVAILAVCVAGYSAARVPAYIPAKPGLETQLRAGLSEPEVRKTALSLAESADREGKHLRTALGFQQAYAWAMAALLLVNSVALFIFFRRLRVAQKREATAYQTSSVGPGPASP